MSWDEEGDALSRMRMIEILYPIHRNESPVQTLKYEPTEIIMSYFYKRKMGSIAKVVDQSIILF